MEIEVGERGTEGEERWEEKWGEKWKEMEGHWER